ncbi:MAG: T9SS type A sorting domain-containing protein [Bacteroidia bacterium]
MRANLLFLLLLSIVNPFNTQAETLDKLGGESNWDIQLLPGMEFSGYWYVWSNGGATLTFSPQLSEQVAWINTITLTNPSSSNCDEITTIKVDYIAPSQTGLYTVTLSDGNGIYPDIIINMLVTDNLTPLDSVFIPGFVNQNIQIPQTETNLGASTLGCLSPFFPGSSQTYTYEWITGNIPGTLATEPTELTLNNGESGQILNSATFTQPGQYTVYRISEKEFSSFLLVGKVVFTISEITSIENEKPKGPILLYPNPASSKVILPLDNTFRLTDLRGREAEVPSRIIDENTMELDVSELSKGMYVITSKEVYYRFIKE